jgi:hypothetical protein
LSGCTPSRQQHPIVVDVVSQADVYQQRGLAWERAASLLLGAAGSMMLGEIANAAAAANEAFRLLTPIGDSALLAPAGIGLGRLGGGRIGGWFAGTGIAAALVQVTGLSRWVLFVPGISDGALVPAHTQDAYHRFQARPRSSPPVSSSHSGWTSPASQTSPATSPGVPGWSPWRSCCCATATTPTPTPRRRGQRTMSSEP